MGNIQTVPSTDSMSSCMYNLLIMMPEFMVAVTAIILLMGGAFLGNKKTVFIHRLGIFSLLAALGFYALTPFSTDSVILFNNLFISNEFTRFIKVILLLATVFVFFMSTRWLDDESRQHPEFSVLMLFSLLGLMLMVSANDLMSLYMGMELSSLALYVLAAFERDTLKSTESGIKYFVLGALASGLFLFGASLVYGFTGSTNFSAINMYSAHSSAISPAVLTGLVLIAVSFCFKISAAPFHMWTPDVYEGAPMPVTAYFSTVPKIAAVALFARLLLSAFPGMHAQWQQVIAFSSMLSMLVGSFGALGQTNIKRLLAYSSIGHIGYILVGLTTDAADGLAGVLIYLSLYLFASAGMFACLMQVKRDGVIIETIADFAGLSSKNPRLAFAIILFMFSMAGIPPLAGFFGKMYIFLAAIQDGFTPLAVLGVLASVVACYYYLKVVKVMYFDEPNGSFDEVRDYSARAVMYLCAFVTLFFFISPAPLVKVAYSVAGSLFH